MKEIKLNVISFILIIFAVIAITSLVVIEIIKCCDIEVSNVLVKNEVNVFNSEREKNFLIQDTNFKINEQILLKPVNLILKEDEAELWLGMNLEGKSLAKSFPLKCKIYDENYNLLYEDEDVANLYENYKEWEFWGTTLVSGFKIENYISNNSKLIFELFDKEDTLLGSLDIDTICNEFKCVPDNKFQQISEIELKEFLGDISKLEVSNNGEIYGNSFLIDAAIFLNYDSIERTELPGNENFDGYSRQGDSAEDIDDIIKSYCGMPIIEDSDEDYIYEKVEMDGKEYYTYVSPGCGPSGSTCLEIKNIEYSDGIYKVLYSYWEQGESSEFDFNLQSVKQRSVELVKNEDGALTEFKILSISENNEAY